MELVRLISIALALSADAFAVAVCKGLTFSKPTYKQAIHVGLYFGFFQAIMPVLGFYICLGFEPFVSYIDHWLAFGLLVYIGVMMIKSSFDKDAVCQDGSLSFRVMIILAIATSIDALATGVVFAIMEINIFVAATLIGCITFVTSCIGFKLGNLLGIRFKTKATLLGGCILVCMGLQILFEAIF
ncbi:MAG: manganese efflux pump MntP family protein [Erysipelotrichaceae bacterium]